MLYFMTYEARFRHSVYINSPTPDMRFTRYYKTYSQYKADFFHRTLSGVVGTNSFKLK